MNFDRKLSSHQESDHVPRNEKILRILISDRKNKTHSKTLEYNAYENLDSHRNNDGGLMENFHALVER